MPSITTRSAWGFDGWRTTPRRLTPSSVTHATIHYDGDRPVMKNTGNKVPQGIHAFHKNGRRWQGVGYHYVIDSKGNIFEGRGTDYQGAHKPSGPGNNATGIGIQLHLGGNETPTKAMIDSLNWLLAYLNKHYGRTLKLTWHGDGFPTSCPGKNVIALIRNGTIGAAQSPAPSKPTNKLSTPVSTVSKKNAVAVDGIMGPATARAWADAIKAPRPANPAQWEKDKMFVRRAQTSVGRTRTGTWDRNDTRALQRLIGSPVDGIWGPTTTRALQSWINKKR